MAAAAASPPPWLLQSHQHQPTADTSSLSPATLTPSTTIRWRSVRPAAAIAAPWRCEVVV
nr:hypothetical protein [Tanacetum cinerariifolium]